MRVLALFYNALPVRWQRRILNRTQPRFLVGVVGLGIDPRGHVILARHRFGAPEWRFLGGFFFPPPRPGGGRAPAARGGNGREGPGGPRLRGQPRRRLLAARVRYTD